MGGKLSVATEKRFKPYFTAQAKSSCSPTDKLVLASSSYVKPTGMIAFGSLVGYRKPARSRRKTRGSTAESNCTPSCSKQYSTHDKAQ